MYGLYSMHVYKYAAVQISMYPCHRMHTHAHDDSFTYIHDRMYIHTSEYNFQNMSTSRYSPVATAMISGTT